MFLEAHHDAQAKVCPKFDDLQADPKAFLPVNVPNQVPKNLVQISMICTIAIINKDIIRAVFSRRLNLVRLFLQSQEKKLIEENLAIFTSSAELFYSKKLSSWRT